MSFLERVKEHPLRSGIPLSMSVMRPIIGAFACKEAFQGNSKRAAALFALGAVSDMDGTVARAVDGTTRAGAYLDPVADGIFRAEVVTGVAARSPVTGAAVAAGEVFNLIQNKRVQRGREKPLIPKKAKLGTAVQSAGAVGIFLGRAVESKTLERIGQTAMVAGTALRVKAYWDAPRVKK